MIEATVAMESDVACPVCAARDAEPIEQRTFGCTFVQCRRCGMRYYSPRMTEDYVLATYMHTPDAKAEAENLYCNGVLTGAPEKSPEYQKAAIETYYVDLLGGQAKWFKLHNSREPTSLFETGCAVGWYMKAARDRILAPPARVAGCDANPYAAAVARERFGFDVVDGRFSHRPVRSEERGSYDLLAAMDYIEHTYTPVEDLRILRDLSAPNGVLILKTFLEEFDTTGSYIHPVFHCNHFTAKTLKLALAEAGWRILEFNDERERVYAQAIVYCTPSTT